MLAEVVDKIEQRGEQRGEHRGEQRKAREYAKKMLDEGFEIAVIARITGLSDDQIRSVKAD